MLFSDAYLSIANAAQGLFKDRGSKFMAYAYPVSNQEEIKQLVEQLKREHPSAVHHCYAWRLGADKTAFRINDDGEPSGTAGKPIFSQIQSKDLSNILIVVVRYFGGSLLGVPGLIQAYRSAAADALAHAEVVEHYILEEYCILFGEEDMNAVMQLLRTYEAQVLQRDYKERHEWTFRVKKSLANAFEEKRKTLYRTELHSLQTL